MDQQSEDAPTIGWDAINAALEPLYAEQEPRHVAPVIPAILGGQDPLDGISAWKRLHPIPHWHFVSYGLSELYDKESDIADVSGFGFELTFRLACEPDQADPPAWAFSLMQNLARYVVHSGNVLRDGEWMNANGPIALETDTLLRSLAFIHDPELPPIDTPHGRVEFIQIVGMTLDEEAALKRWQTRKLLETLLPHMPLWTTDLSRPSLLDAPGVRETVVAGTAQDGSSTGLLFTPVLAWKPEKRILGPATIVISMGASQVEDFASLLALRLPHGNPVHLASNEANVLFAPGDGDGLSEVEGALRVELTSATTLAFARTLQPIAGSYAVPGFGLRFDVQRSLIRDASGNIIRTVG